MPHRSDDGHRAAELLTRREKLLEHLRGSELTGYALFGDDYIRDFTGFNFLATERPVAVVGNTSGDMCAFVPEFEVERVRARRPSSRSSRIPSIRAPSIRSGSSPLLEELGVTGPVGADQDGYPGNFGYRGSAERGHRQTVRPLAPFIESLMVRKSEAEVGLIRESARSSEHAHRLLQQYTRPGATEADASLRAGHEATLAMLEALDGRTAASKRRPTASRPATAARSASAARGRTQWPTTSSSRRATSSSPRRARRSGLQRRAGAAMIIGAPTTRCDGSSTHGRGPAGGLRGAPSRHDLRRRRPRGAGVLRGQRPAALLAPARRPCDRPRNHEAPFLDVGDHTRRAGNGLHDRAGALLGRGGRLPPLGHGRRHRGRDRHPDLVPERHRKPDDSGLRIAQTDRFAV